MCPFGEKKNSATTSAQNEQFGGRQEGGREGNAMCGAEEHQSGGRGS